MKARLKPNGAKESLKLCHYGSVLVRTFLAARDRKPHSHWVREEQRRVFLAHLGVVIYKESGMAPSRGSNNVIHSISLSLNPSLPSHPMFFPPPLSSAFLCVSSMLMQNLPLEWQDAASSVLPEPAPGRAIPFTPELERRGPRWL